MQTSSWTPMQFLSLGRNHTTMISALPISSLLIRHPGIVLLFLRRKVRKTQFGGSNPPDDVQCDANNPFHLLIFAGFSNFNSAKSFSIALFH